MEKYRKIKQIDISRRRLLGGAVGMGAAGVGLGALGAASARQLPATPPAAAKTTDATYHETEHIRRYYQTAW